jgi:multimeric flavodoxin WrbA
MKENPGSRSPVFPGGPGTKKVTVFVGSAHKRMTLDAVRAFLADLEALGGVEPEIVTLSDYSVGTCRGCRLCFDQGEESCPMRDDRDALIARLDSSDGVVLASPNYSFQVSALMKTFLDRLGFAFHRPRFFGKAFTSIVTQGIYGGEKIVKYLDFVGAGLGFNVVKGQCFTAFDPMTEAERRKRDRALSKQSRRFHSSLMKASYPPPTLIKLMAFRMGRTSVRLELDESRRDFTYYRDKGWFESGYFYPARLGPVKKAVGRLFDSIQARRTGKRLGRGSKSVGA